MKPRRALAGALALATAARRALALPLVVKDDRVVLIQHSVTGVVSKSSPVSLLAVNSRSSSKWYDTSAEDEELVRKLNDRIKANEEREREQALLKSAADASGASFLNESGRDALQDALQERSEATRWLTQADMDNWAEDHHQMLGLGAELQRIAAQVANIATHQKDFGAHLGLPDHVLERFEAGDQVEIKIAKGRNKGNYAKAVIAGFGSRPNTYNVRVPGSKDVKDVSARSLRRDESAVKDGPLSPARMQYTVGEQAQVKIQVGPSKGSWVRCTIRSLGPTPDTYNIHVKNAPPGHRDLASVPASELRKAETTGLFTQYDVDGDGHLSAQEFNIALKEKATSIRNTDSTNSSRALFTAGETAEVQSSTDSTNGSSWINCTIMGEGAFPDSFNIFVPSYQVGSQYLPNVPVEQLRNTGDNRTASDLKVKLIPPQVDHEVIAPRGMFKGRWVPCQIKRQGRVDTLDVWLPYGVASGHNLIRDVQTDRVRVRTACGDGYDDIFDGDFPGRDHFGRTNNRKDTVTACAADCNKRAECRSFEWSQSTKECNLNREANPMLPGKNDQMFCRRKETLQNATAPWTGPLLGQDLEYLVPDGPHGGEWLNCTLLAFGTRPDTYTVNATNAWPGRPDNFVNLTGLPFQFLRFSKDKPVPSMALNWVPPTGERAAYGHGANVRDPTEQAVEETEGMQQSFLVDNSKLNSKNKGMSFRSSMQLNDTAGPEAFAAWGSYVTGVDVGNGWVRVGKNYLPTTLKGSQVLTPQIEGKEGEAIQVQKEDGVWVPATIKSKGDEPNAFNVLTLEGATSRYLNNVVVAQIRKEISLPVVVVTEPPSLAVLPTTTPVLVSAAKVSMPLLEKQGHVAQETSKPAAALTTLPAHNAVQPMTTPVPASAAGSQPSAQLPSRARLGQDVQAPEAPARAMQQTPAAPQARRAAEEHRGKAEESGALAREAPEAPAPAPREFLIDNSRLHHKGPGLAFRASKRLDDTIGRDAFAVWGSFVTGVYEHDGWLEVGGQYLPTTVKGVPVVLLKVTGEPGEIVQVQQEDGSWAHGTMRGKGNWPGTFNIHVMDNAAGYNIDNVASQRIRKELDEQPAPVGQLAEALAAGQRPAEAPLAADAIGSAGLEPEPGVDLEELGEADLGEDLPDGIFRVNMTAEVKINAGPRAGAWVKCRVVDQGDATETYNLFVPSAPYGYQDLINIPALAIRKLKKVRTNDPVQHNPSAIEVDGIDGEVDESIEVLVQKGRLAGQYVPGIITGIGAVPDSFNIRLPGPHGTHRDVANMPGSRLRKAKRKVEILPEPDYPKYEAGEEVEVKVPVGKDGTSSIIYNCTIVRQGDFSNTYDCELPDKVLRKGVHARFLRKLEFPKEPVVSTEQADTDSVFSLKNFIELLETLRPDMKPVVSGLLEARRDVMVWLKRVKDWDAGCSEDDRMRMVAKLHWLGEASSDEVITSLPPECTMNRWAQPAGVDWEDLAACAQAAFETSRSCAACPVRAALHVAEGCLVKCQPIFESCTPDQQASESCASSAGRCLECLQEPAEGLMNCAGLPERTAVMSAVDQLVAQAKAGTFDIEGALRQNLSPNYFISADKLAKKGLQTLHVSWKAIMGKFAH